MKKTSVIVLCIILFGIGVHTLYKYKEIEKGRADEFATWKEFTPQSEMFKVLLPNHPQYGNDMVDIPGTDLKRHYDIYASEKIDGTLFLVEVITYPSEVDVSSSDEILKNNLDAFMKGNSDNHLKKLLHSVFRTHKSIEFSFSNREFDIEGKSIQNGSVVYMLAYIAKKDELDEIEYKHFLDSFQILNLKSDDKAESRKGVVNQG